MNRYPLPLRHRLSFRWASRRALGVDVRNALSTAALLIGLLLVYAITGTLDYQDALQTEARENALRAERAEQALIDCMNARARWIYDNHTGRGYSKTAVVCRGVEEFPI